MKRITKVIMLATTIVLLLTMAIGCAKTQTSTEQPQALEEGKTTVSDETVSEETASDEIDLSKFTIGFSQDWNYIEWTQMMRDHIIEACEKYGINYTGTDANNSGEKQISDIEDLITLGVDCILVSTYHADTIGNAVQEAMDKGIPVIVLSSEIPGVTPTCHISADSIGTGELCAKTVVEKFPKGANIIQLTGKEGSIVNQMRGEGFHNVLDSKPEYNILAELSCNYSRSEALKTMEDLIGVHRDKIDVVYTHNDDMALGAIQAIEEAGMKANVNDGIYVISAADAIYEEVYEAIDAEKMISHFYPTFGWEGVEAAIEMFKGNTVEPKLIVEAPAVIKGNVSEYWKKK